MVIFGEKKPHTRQKKKKHYFSECCEHFFTDLGFVSYKLMALQSQRNVS